MNRLLNFLIGTFTALLGSFVFGCIFFRLFTGMNPFTDWSIFTYGNVASKAFSIGSIPNIGLFYLFLNRDNYDSARGVIFSFIIIALYIIFG